MNTDYDTEETVQKKLKRFGEEKSNKGFKNLVKDLTGVRKRRAVLGCLKLPLKDIPQSGWDNWFILESKNPNSKKQKGQLHLKLGIGAQKEKKVITQEYQHALHLMLLHELVQERQNKPFEWEEDFQNDLSAAILRNLQLKCGLSKKDVDLAKWLVYTKVHCEKHPLNVNIFPKLLQTMLSYLNSQSFADDEKVLVFDGSLIDNVATLLRNNSLPQLYFLFSTPQLQYMLETPKLLISYLAGNPHIGNQCNSPLTADIILQKTQNAISERAIEFFDGIAKFNPNSGESQLERLVNVAQLLIADLGKSSNLHQSDFKELLGVGHFDITYLVYDKKYFEILNPIVAEVRKSLKLLNLIFESEYDCCQAEYVSVGTTLFRLYTLLKQFAKFSTTVKTAQASQLCIPGTVHNWFQNTIIVQWLDIARYEAMKCIKTAVKLDNLELLDDPDKITSSAIDTVSILQRVEIWNQLSCPEVEGSCSFIPKILDDLGSCVIFYAGLMCKKCENNVDSGEEIYHVSDKLCYTINNIEWVAQQMRQNKEGESSVFEKLAEKHGPCTRSQCQRTSSRVIENAKENIKNKTIGMLAEVGMNMRSTLEKLVGDAAENKSEDGNYVKKLETYLDKNLITLKTILSQATFARVFEFIWDNVLEALSQVIATNIEKKGPPELFKRITSLIPCLVDLFYPDDSENTDLRKIQKIKNSIKFLAATTLELVLMYCGDRLTMQSKMGKTSHLGFLTVRAFYCEDIQALKVEVLNARHLKPRANNRPLDSYVKVHLVTEKFLPTKASGKTKTKKKSLFPTFEETFSLPLQMGLVEMSCANKGFIMFSIKDYGRFGTSEFIGDCLLPLDSIPICSSETKFEDLEQQILPLTLPKKEDNSVAFQTLETRSWNRSITEFMNRENIKIGLAAKDQ
ncbi:Protein unc-13 D [Orchesella cincta]|uniref:Protein unc-13 D n=1 Tax=Orchesella cincta TaxID=48709 RepID=A0A1D2MEM8_ORCCI|nr:Protein unc-13 D [Orchesella cincta]